MDDNIIVQKCEHPAKKTRKTCNNRIFQPTLAGNIFVLAVMKPTFFADDINETS